MWSFIERLWSARISLYPPDEARLRSLNLTLAIAGRAIGSLQVGAADAGREPLLRTRLGRGFIATNCAARPIGRTSTSRWPSAAAA